MASNEELTPSHLSPSELGTKEYWESFYERSLSHLSSKNKPPQNPSTQQNSTKDTNADEDEADDDDDDDASSSDDDGDLDSDPGTSWFTEHNAPQKVLDFLTSEKFPLSPTNNPPNEPTILDLGTGNGSMLALLREEGGFGGVMVGVDYSAKSVELARRLYPSSASPAADRGGGDEGGLGIRFEEWDILGVKKEDFTAQGMPEWFPAAESGFDIVLDKGTFDAVSLCEEEEEDGKVIRRRVCERYPGVAKLLVKNGGYLVVTSCNWTEEELVRWFTRVEDGEGGDGDRLVVWGRVEYPKFRFGGQEGQGVCTEGGIGSSVGWGAD
ncbi:hypothetical protein FQN54_003586 [Arachnomyces sp. PD_36]|nr:hypothetical protein FQN54_003586 [Arachnomyces sp. PD_36]